mmetsp:Transcript_4484/g.8662  ORF Transcript_4484/g.8662 Transcript_4484/m.8662 type:complete len:324 (-) Transcript_4484:329-1300(-)
MKIKMPKEALMEPNYESLKNGLENLIEFFSGKNIEFVCKPNFLAMNCFLHPELHEESIGFIVKHRFFQELNFSSGFTRFSFRDYFFPNFPKVRKIFSAIINFAKFREEFLIFIKKQNQNFGRIYLFNVTLFREFRYLKKKKIFLFGKFSFIFFRCSFLKKKKKFSNLCFYLQQKILLGYSRTYSFFFFTAWGYIRKFLLKKKTQCLIKIVYDNFSFFSIFQFSQLFSIGQINTEKVFWEVCSTFYFLLKFYYLKIFKIKRFKLTFFAFLKNQQKLEKQKNLIFSIEPVKRILIFIFINSKNILNVILKVTKQMKKKKKSTKIF